MSLFLEMVDYTIETETTKSPVEPVPVPIDPQEPSGQDNTLGGGDAGLDGNSAKTGASRANEDDSSRFKTIDD